MRKSEITKEVQFNKYERNLLKAEALQLVGQALERELERAEEELKCRAEYLDDKYDELMNEHDDDEDISRWDVQWKLESARSSLEKSRIEIVLWKKTIALIDKELG